MTTNPTAPNATIASIVDAMTTHPQSSVWVTIYDSSGAFASAYLERPVAQALFAGQPVPPNAVPPQEGQPPWPLPFFPPLDLTRETRYALNDLNVRDIPASSGTRLAGIKASTVFEVYINQANENYVPLVPGQTGVADAPLPLLAAPFGAWVLLASTQQGSPDAPPPVIPPVHNWQPYHVIAQKGAYERSTPVAIPGVNGKVPTNAVGNGFKFNDQVIVDIANPVNGYYPIQGGNFVAQSVVAPSQGTPITPAPIVQPTPPVTPNNPMPVSYSRNSVHYMPGGDWAHWAGILQSRAAAGKPVPGMLLLRAQWGGEPTPADVKTASPQTEVMVRHYLGSSEPQPDWTQPNLYSVGQSVVTNWQAWTGDEKADFVQLINEPSTGPGTVSFWNGALDAAKTRGIKLAVGCFSVYNPPLDFWPSFYDTLRRVRDEGHRLMLHQYRPDDATGKEIPIGSTQAAYVASLLTQDAPQRHKDVYAAFPADLQRLPLVFGEYGTVNATQVPLDWFTAGLKAVDAAQASDPVLWRAWWTDGGMSSWHDSLLSTAQVDAIGAL